MPQRQGVGQLFIMEAPETSREPSNLLYSQATERAYRGQLEEVARARDSETAALARVSELEARLSSQTSQLVAAQQLADALQVRFSMFFFNCCFVWGGGIVLIWVPVSACGT